MIAICTTTSSRAEAVAIARACVEEGLAACVHLDEIDSFYLWEGKMNEDREYRLLLKASDNAYDRIEARIRELHSYDEPAIYAFPVTRAGVSYSSWVEANSAG